MKIKSDNSGLSLRKRVENVNKTDFKEFAYLLERAREGDDEAFQEIYHRTKGAQILHLVGVMGETDEVKDALQEVYALLYKNLDKINPPTVLIAYLNRLSFYVGKNLHRKERNRNNTFTDLEWLDNGEGVKKDDVLKSIEDKEKLQLVRSAIGELPQPEQSVIFMRYYQKMKHQDVAISLGVSTAKAKRLQHSAQEMLRSRLREQGIRSWSILVAQSLSPRSHSSETGEETISTAAGTSTGMSGAGGVLTACMAMAGLSVALLGGSSFLGSPSIENVNIPAELTSKAKIDITADSRIPIRKVILKSENGEILSGRQKNTGIYLAEVSENGSYTLTLTANNGRTASRKIHVDCIDSKIPTVSDIQPEGEKITITFAPDESGIDYESIYCEGKKGPVQPESIDESRSAVTFRLPAENHTLFFKDGAGNLSQMPLYYEGKSNK